MDPCQIDWNYQIKNRPAIIGQVEQINPDLGPFAGPILILDAATGFLLAAGPTLSLALASLTQQGTIGTAGGQQLQGPLYMVGNPAAGSAPPLTGHSWGAVIQDGGLGFYSSADGPLTSLNAGITYGPFHALNVTNHNSILIEAGVGPTSAALTLKNGATGNQMEFFPNGDFINQFGNLWQAIGTPTTTKATFSPFFPPNTWCFDIESADSPGPAYTLQAGTLIGQYGTDATGNTFSGGILTRFAASPAFPWSGITGTPTTFSGYGLTTPILPGDAAGGDLGGTYPNATVTALQGHAVAATSPTTGQVLTWGGFFWAPAAPAGGGLTIGSAISGGTSGAVLYGDAINHLAQTGNMTYSGAGGFVVLNGTFSSILGQVACASFQDFSSNVVIGNNTQAILVTGGNISVRGASNQTIEFRDASFPPNTVQSVSAPASAYGQGTISQFLGTPDTWARVTINGTDYLLPAYLP